MKYYKILQKTLLIFLIIILFLVSCNSYAAETLKNNSNKDSILTESEKQEFNINSPVEEKSQYTGEIPEISNQSKQLLKSFDKDISEIKETERVYDNVLNRETIRITSINAEIDLDNNGNIVSYKNLDDFSSIDKNKRDYNENEDFVKNNYEITQLSDLSDTISLIESENDLIGYELTDCSDSVEGTWILTWCKSYGNELINPYDCVNVVIDAKDGSIMLFGKNAMNPNTTVPTLTQDEAIRLADTIISKFDNKDAIDVKLTFFRPNYYWNDGELYESEDFVRLSWEVSIKDCVSVQIDAETGEVLGGAMTESTDCARSMSVVSFTGQQERATLAYNAFNRLGYNQSNYPAVSWSISQTDIDWMLSRSDMYGLYLNCHGGVSNGLSVLADASTLSNANWQVWSNNNFGNWHFVYLDACLTSSNNNFANAFHATGSGRCFVGWNISIAAVTALDFDRRFLPRLGTMSVYDDVITSLWESRNAGYNSGNYTCNPGFLGDTNYYGWAW